MRKISKIMASCFFNKQPMKLSNTEVKVLENGTSCLYLFGNLIAYITINDDMFFSCCGWLTRTTLDRLNALGLNLSQSKGILYYNNKPISTYGIHQAIYNEQYLIRA